MCSVFDLRMHLGRPRHIRRRAALHQNDPVVLISSARTSVRGEAAVEAFESAGSRIPDYIFDRRVGIMVNRVRLWLSRNREEQPHQLVPPIHRLRGVFAVHGKLALRVPRWTRHCHGEDDTVVRSLQI